MLANQEFEGPGFFGVGFNSIEMTNAEIWFCFVNEDQWGLRATNATVEEDCSLEPIENNVGEAADNEDFMFSCCVAHSHFNSKPICAKPGDDVFYELIVTNWCMSKSSASVTVSTRLCGNDEDGGGCFKTNLGTTTNIIVAYNHVGQNRPHGYERRTNAEINLVSGSFDGGGGVADKGLIATHAIFMLFCWMICAPAAVFVSIFRTQSDACPIFCFTFRSIIHRKAKRIHLTDLLNFLPFIYAYPPFAYSTQDYAIHEDLEVSCCRTRYIDGFQWWYDVATIGWVGSIRGRVQQTQ